MEDNLLVLFLVAEAVRWRVSCVQTFLILRGELPTEPTKSKADQQIEIGPRPMQCVFLSAQVAPFYTSNQGYFCHLKKFLKHFSLRCAAPKFCATSADENLHSSASASKNVWWNRYEWSDSKSLYGAQDCLGFYVLCLCGLWMVGVYGRRNKYNYELKTTLRCTTKVVMWYKQAQFSQSATIQNTKALRAE